MPPYVIAHDATLAAIAEARPASLSALRRVKGMGPAKLEKYGDGILDVLATVPETPPRLLASAPARNLHRICGPCAMDRPYAGRTHREIT